jgi:hypothetical protein
MMRLMAFILAAGIASAQWTDLIRPGALTGWKHRKQTKDPWVSVSDVRWNPRILQERLEPVGDPGVVLLNGMTGKSADLVTEATFGDIELSLEFLTPTPANSGVYLHGLYEVQILDDRATEGGLHDCGAIYQRWIDGKGVGGQAPLRKPCGPPGTWQSFEIRFRAPRFSAAGAKTENARFVRVLHNGVLIHENVEVTGPTRASLEIREAATNPLMLQGDHGPVAFRNIRVRPLAHK